ncbi:flotillin family protein [Lachnospiraceae bacterium MD1]|jgi:flotillin|uniref:Flotillin family protein n=1 Tax=Variimorphobacter saccharofermentans TaxID=2755051 RepID=A0A839JUW8_9FIRM|nr:flotillin family protein [Variimorphobacter saccharofermentans]MBB2181475.1 flotillin family protein [Variimorphobacter saccharofermentans]
MLTSLDITPIIITGVAVIAGLALLTVIFRMWRKVPQDKAMVVTGMKKRVITGGGGLVIPILERTDTISLGNIQLNINTSQTMSSQGVPIDVVGTAVIKVRNTHESIYAAIEQFTGANEMQIQKSISDQVTLILEGKLREIVASMTVEQIYNDREAFSAKVQEVVGTKIGEMGLELKDFSIKDVNDTNGYIRALGAKQIAEKKKDAEIAQAMAQKEESIKKSEAAKEGERARLQAETEVSAAKKAKEVQEAEYRIEQESAKAKADAAYDIQKSITLQDVIAAQMEADILRQQKQKELQEAQLQVEIAREQKQIELEQRRAEKTREELKTKVVEPANAELEQKKAAAEAEKYTRIAEAQARAEAKKAEAAAEAEAIKLKAKAEADAEAISGEAKAKAISVVGVAEAEAIKAKGLAEAEAMEKKAEAYKKYTGAAMADKLIEKLPEIAKAIAEPLSQISDIKIYGGGVESVTDNVPTVLAKVFETVESSVGIDMKSIVMADSLEARTTKNVNVTGMGDSISKELE